MKLMEYTHAYKEPFSSESYNSNNLNISQEYSYWRHLFLKLFLSYFFLQEIFWPSSCKVFPFPGTSLRSVDIYGKSYIGHTRDLISVRTYNEIGNRILFYESH